MNLHEISLEGIWENQRLYDALSALTNQKEPDSAMAKWLQGRISNDGFGYAVVVEENDVAIGWMIVYPCGTRYHAVDMFVHPDHRNRGIARRLAHEALTTKRFPTSTAAVFSDIPFYRHIMPHGSVDKRQWDHNTYIVPKINPTYRVYQQHKGANVILPDVSSINEVRSLAQCSQDALYRVFAKSPSGSERFTTAFSVLGGKVRERTSVTIPKEHW